MNRYLTDQLLALVDAFQAIKPFTDVTLSKYAADDSRFVPSLRTYSVAVSGVRYDKVVAWFAANAPEGMKWPPGVTRPTRKGSRDLFRPSREKRRARA